MIGSITERLIELLNDPDVDWGRYGRGPVAYLETDKGAVVWLSGHARIPLYACKAGGEVSMSWRERRKVREAARRRAAYAPEVMP